LCLLSLHANWLTRLLATLLSEVVPPFSLAALSESISAKALLLSPVLEAPAAPTLNMSPLAGDR